MKVTAIVPMKEHIHMISMHGAGSELILGETVFMHTEQSHLPHFEHSSGTLGTPQSPLLRGHYGFEK